MKKSAFAKTMQCIAIATGLAAAAALGIWHFVRLPMVFTLFISIFTVFYHFSVRLLIGYLVPNQWNPNGWWFRPRRFEAALFRAIRIQKWKLHMPTYDPSKFSLKHNSYETLLKNMCQAELVHTVIIPFSFVPLLFSIPWGEFWVFFATSFLAACFDLLFVMMQRYNRPRIMKIFARRAGGKVNG